MSGEVFAAGLTSEGTPAMALVLGIFAVWALSTGAFFELIGSQWVIMLFAAVLAASVISGSIS